MTKVLTEPRSIRIKGRSFLAVVLTPDPPFDDWLVRLDDLAARSAGFFLGRPVVLDVSDIEIDKPQLKALIAELAARNVSIMGIEGGRPSLVEPGMPPQLKGGKPAADYEVPREEAAEPSDAKPKGKAEKKPAEQAAPQVTVQQSPVSAPSLIVRETIRSGQSVIYTQGDVTVIGSVQSGAEVIAGGSVHIYGALRGRALAGCVGNADARIFCRKFESELVAIDGVYAMTDDMDPELKGHPVQLWLEGDAIMTERMT
ncbi:septum site-determining protein MinC [Rhizobium rosettiformans]|uniref:septum site-determining protein MinC n=1 Tax=Rhizobium rosettiformans TaxID=1368430 RepID=UPI00182682A9|nr:septum site-determining protein MinC [Rhizobium rosettiformans]MBA4799079.1 septum site-determining protein MinC [Hyphomicrobiales bacterium]MDR7028859.1 septum site-determining protein MinC [Rhizobium rosettiformans]MDR7063859.1 septum site-determining protein MinC [Rhizobium rosettiformans]MEC9461578.1 septum site-determining protein MinC [Pseudomonadota bacterium]